MLRRWIYRDDSPAAWRLELADDLTFSFAQTVYAGDDGFEHTASGRWHSRASELVLVVIASDCSLLPIGKEVALRCDVGSSLWLRGARLEPDMPLRYTFDADKELWKLQYDLVLGRNGTFVLTRNASGVAGDGETRLLGTWELTADAIELRPETGLPSRLVRLDGNALDLTGSRLEPLD